MLVERLCLGGEVSSRCTDAHHAARGEARAYVCSVYVCAVACQVGHLHVHVRLLAPRLPRWHSSCEERGAHHALATWTCLRRTGFEGAGCHTNVAGVERRPNAARWLVRDADASYADLWIGMRRCRPYMYYCWYTVADGIHTCSIVRIADGMHSCCCLPPYPPCSTQLRALVAPTPV